MCTLAGPQPPHMVKLGSDVACSDMSKTETQVIATYRHTDRHEKDTQTCHPAAYSPMRMSHTHVKFCRRQTHRHFHTDTPYRQGTHMVTDTPTEAPALPSQITGPENRHTCSLPSYYPAAAGRGIKPSREAGIFLAALLPLAAGVAASSSGLCDGPQGALSPASLTFLPLWPYNDSLPFCQKGSLMG